MQNTIFALLFLATPLLRAQDSQLDAVIFDQPGDGRIWAMAEDYKASFGPEGASFIPFFGSQAPANYPVAFRLSSITVGGEPLAFTAAPEPAREDNRITLPRGRVHEFYSLGLKTMEQEFLIDTRGLSGELILRMVIDSELAARMEDGTVVFANEHGSVRYSQAFCFDAEGGRHDIETALRERELTLTVSADQVAAARGQLRIDPLLSVYTLNNDSADDCATDVAKSSSSNQGVTVWERIFSDTDHDILIRQRNDDGNNLGSVLSIDISTAYWSRPSVAHRAAGNDFLVVAAAGLPGAQLRTIRGRSIEIDMTINPSFTISNTTADCAAAVVGGDDNNGGATLALVVINTRYLNAAGTPVNWGIETRTVDLADQAVGGATLQLLPGELAEPAVSKSCGRDAGRYWGVVWTRRINDQRDIWLARVNSSGGTLTLATAIESGAADAWEPSISTPLDAPSFRCLAVWTAPSAQDTTIQAALLDVQSVVDTRDLMGLVNLSYLEPQHGCKVDSDGREFVAAWSQQMFNSSTGGTIFVTTVAPVGDRLLVAQNTNLTGNSDQDDRVALTGARGPGGAARRFWASWINFSPITLGDVWGLRYESSPFTVFCTPNSNGTNGCPCGNDPTVGLRGCQNSSLTGGGGLEASGNVDADTWILSASHLRPNSTTVFLQGTATNLAGAAFGDGMRCVAGQLLRLAVKTSDATGSTQYPELGDAGIKARMTALGFPVQAGQKRPHQVYYRDPSQFGCTSTYNMSSAVQVQF